MKRIAIIFVAVLLMVTLTACSSDKSTDSSVKENSTEKITETLTEQSKPVIDYGDAESFEAALNNGEDLEGKIVAFTADEYHPDSKLGRNIWAGEHLNFVSSENPNINEGDTVVVKVNKIENLLGSWVINYEKIDAVKADSTITAANSALVVQKEDELPLELKDSGWYADPTEYSDEVYIHFCGMVHNPNETLKAEFPEVIVTVKGDDGSILGTGNQMGFVVMPEDTVTFVGMFSMSLDDFTDDADIYFDVDWSEFTSANKSTEARTTDFTVSNVSERSGSKSRITGEVTNNTDEDQMVNLSMVLRKNGEIVFMDNTFLDGCKPGKPKAFEFESYGELPEHDKIEISAQPW